MPLERIFRVAGLKEGSTRAAKTRLLDRPYLDVPVSHDAPGRLQRHRAARVFRVVGLSDQNAIQPGRHVRPSGADLDRRPAIAGVVLRQGLGDIDDGACAAGLIGALVVDVELVPVLDARILLWRCGHSLLQLFKPVLDEHHAYRRCVRIASCGLEHEESLAVSRHVEMA